MAAILAGGEGRRLGGVTKPLLPLGNRRIIDRQLRVVRPVVDRVVVVTGSAAQTSAFGDLDLPVWIDDRPGQGPLGGILTALLRGGVSSTLIVAGDLPYLRSSFLRYLLELARPADHDAVVPRPTGIYQPLCAVYRQTCVEAIRDRLDRGRRSVIEMLSDLRVREVGETEMARFDPEGTLLLNINTTADYERACRLDRGPMQPS